MLFKSFTGLIFGLLIVCTSLAQESATVWKGTLDARGTKLRLEVEISKEKDGLVGELRSLDQNNAKLDLDDVIVEGKQLSFSIPQLNADFIGDYNEDKSEVVGTFTQSGIELPLNLAKGAAKKAESKAAKAETLKEAWVGKLDMGIVNPVMQFRIIESEGEPLAYFDSITEGQTGFTGTWSIGDEELSFEIPKINLEFHGKLNAKGDAAKGIWSQGGRDVPLTLKRQAKEYDSKNVWDNRPQRPVGPFPYDAEEVTFKNKIDTLTLAGTLTIPKKSGKHPAVILISGSGPQDRDESLMEHKPFLVLADYLSRRGIAVLRYDDRGTAESTGNFGSATTEDFAKDAAAAMEFLKTHPRINSAEIGLAGHSEGGLIAPMVCGLRDDVAFVALLAATGVDGVTIATSQTEAMLRAEKPGPEEYKEVTIAIAMNKLIISRGMRGELDLNDPEFKNEVDALIEQMPADERKEASSIIESEIKSAKKRMDQPWMKFFITYDPRPALSKIECPVLAIVGSKDLQVLPELNMPEIEKALKQGGNQDFKMATLEGLNHLFQKCELGTMTEYATIQETFNPKALIMIGDWIEAHTTIIK